MFRKSRIRPGKINNLFTGIPTDRDADDGWDFIPNSNAPILNKYNFIIFKNQKFFNDFSKSEKDFIYDTRNSNRLFSQLMICEFCSVFFASMGILLSIINYEYKNKEKTQSESFNSTIIQIYIMITTCFLVFSIYVRYQLWIKWAISTNKFTKFDTLSTTGIWKPMVVEIILNSITPNTAFEGL